MPPSIPAILHSIRPEFDFTESEDFFRDGMLDSLDMVTLVTTLDETYATSIDGTDIVPENFSSVARIRELMAKYGVRA